jgi:hypothetical protein
MPNAELLFPLFPVPPVCETPGATVIVLFPADSVVVPYRSPPAPPPPPPPLEDPPPPEAPPATTKYSTLRLEPKAVVLNVESPVDVNSCVRYPPLVVIVPPVGNEEEFGFCLTSSLIPELFATPLFLDVGPTVPLILLINGIYYSFRNLS